MINNLKNSRKGNMYFSKAIVFICLISLSVSCKVEKTLENKKPNILFIFADDLTYNAVNALGNKELKTPALDNLVAEGTSFSNAYNMGAWNGAVCVASRSMLLSGMSLWNANRAQKNFPKRAAEGELWGNLMANAGYTTYFTGKWHTESTPEAVFGTIGTRRPGMPKDTKIGYNRPLSKTDTIWKPWDKNNGGYWNGEKHWTEATADEAIVFIDKAKNMDNPFFMYIAFNAPHDPRQSPIEYINKYDLDSISIPENFLKEYPYKQEIGCYKVIDDKTGLEKFQRDEYLAPYPRTEYSIKVNRQEYYASISYLDHHINRILKSLQNSGKADNTYIIFSADHGLAVGHHGLLGKQSMYEHSMKAPLIIVGPNIPKNQKKEDLVYIQDIMATTLDLAGAKKPDYVEFRSLIPSVNNYEKANNYESIYGAYLNLQRMVRKGDFKLIIYPEVPTALLFNVVKDPLEMNNLAKNIEYDTTKKSLFAELVRLQKHYKDPLKIDPLIIN